jgi:hypothetical protein
LKWFSIWASEICNVFLTIFNVGVFILQGLISIPWFYFVVFAEEIGETPQWESIFIVCACAVRVCLSCACVFATKTMAVRIFRRAKISNFGEIFLPIVHLFRLGSNGFWYSKFLSIYSCENYVVTRGVQRNCIFWMLILRPNSPVCILLSCSYTLPF